MNILPVGLYKAEFTPEKQNQPIACDNHFVMISSLNLNIFNVMYVCTFSSRYESN